MEPTVTPAAARTLPSPRVSAVHVPTPVRRAGTVPRPRVAADVRGGDLHVHVGVARARPTPRR